MSTELENEQWVWDVSSGEDLGLRAFCPITEDGGILVGLTMLTDSPPGPVVGLFHPAGEEAIHTWTETHPDWRSQVEAINEGF